jgi:hypothetical protein
MEWNGMEWNRMECLFKLSIVNIEFVEAVYI